MDSAAIEKFEQPKRQRRSIAEKRKIAEQAMLPGTSVAAVARQYGVNASLAHSWHNLYRQGRSGEKEERDRGIRLPCPVRISESAVPPVLEPEAAVVSDYFSRVTLPPARQHLHRVPQDPSPH